VGGRRRSTATHVGENAEAVDIRLTSSDLALLDRQFAPPRAKEQLAMA
jgi:diketogulonate reductase-like aldo/keto reductase